jgi:hypothetical protein
VYSLNLDTGDWSSSTYPGGPGNAVSTGTYDRWSYVPALDAYILVNMSGQDAYTFRFSGSPLPVTAPAAPSDVQVQ